MVKVRPCGKQWVSAWECWTELRLTLASASVSALVFASVFQCLKLKGFDLVLWRLFGSHL